MGNCRGGKEMRSKVRITRKELISRFGNGSQYWTGFKITENGLTWKITSEERNGRLYRFLELEAVQ